MRSSQLYVKCAQCSRKAFSTASKEAFIRLLHESGWRQFPGKKIASADWWLCPAHKA